MTLQEITFVGTYTYTARFPGDGCGDLHLMASLALNGQGNDPE
jgi:hypothetical protein